MAIAITEEHRELGATVSDFVAKRGCREATRALLDGAEETLPATWSEMAELGWLGLHVPEALGGSGFGLEELVVVIEELSRAVAPGPFVPTVVVSAVLAAAGNAEASAALLPGLVDGSIVGAVGLGGSVTVKDGVATGNAGTVVSARLASRIMVRAGGDVVIVEPGAGVTIDSPPSVDPSRSSSRVTLDGAPAIVLAGAAHLLRDIGRLLFAADAIGIAREATDMAAAYAKVREQFGRPIAMFQGVKHHCANMAVATEMATGAVWDAARASKTGGDQFSLTAAAAATLAAPAADLCANLNTQVHGGIAMTWEHDAHFFMRRATTLLSILDVDAAATDLADLTRSGVVRAKAVELPPEAEAIRTEVRAFAQSLKGLSNDEQRARLIETGYVMPHWPAPYGRNAGAIEQLVIDEEFKAADVYRPAYGITAWNILTIIQFGNQDQLDRWVRPALNEEVIWCQLFSEPDAGSDAAGVKTKATRVDGGWLVNGQKVWTSGAHLAGMGFATVRTNAELSKHEGITMMAIDMHANGVEVRPLKQTSGQSHFNEVFFTDVFVPDDDVVGPVDNGWTVARATLGNESVSIGGGIGSTPGTMLLKAYDAHPERLNGGVARIGRYLAGQQGIAMLNVRAASRAVEGGGPGPEGAMTKLVLSEIGHEAVAIAVELAGPDAAFLDGEGMLGNTLMLMHRGMSIAGGTSEIKRNQIGERILGLPRDPLLK